MSSVAVHHHFSTFLDAVVAGDAQTIASTASEALTRAEDTSELIGKIGLVAMRGDSEGHTVLTLAAAAMLCRNTIALRSVFGGDTPELTSSVPLVVKVLTAAAPAVKAGKDVVLGKPETVFPGELKEGETVSSRLHAALFGRDLAATSRLLFGLYGTGADYRTLSLRLYDAVSQTFQEDGHSLLFAVRGAQILDAVEWGEDTPNYIHWLAPHLPLHTEEPSWLNDVRGFLQDGRHSLASYRTRLAAPQDENALPLRKALLSDAATSAICENVYNALIRDGAGARGVASVIALAASDLLQTIDASDHERFTRAAHGLLLASATRLIYAQVQDIATLPQLFTTAAAVNALAKELGTQAAPAQTAPHPHSGGGLIASALLETLREQVKEQDVDGAFATARRYVQLGHDPHALCAMIGLSADQADVSADQGHTLQIVQAACDEYLSWPRDLAQTNAEGFLRVALSAAALAKR